MEHVICEGQFRKIYYFKVIFLSFLYGSHCIASQNDHVTSKSALEQAFFIKELQFTLITNKNYVRLVL